MSEWRRLIIFFCFSFILILFCIFCCSVVNDSFCAWCVRAKHNWFSLVQLSLYWISNDFYFYFITVFLCFFCFHHNSRCHNMQIKRPKKKQKLLFPIWVVYILLKFYIWPLLNALLLLFWMAGWSGLRKRN